MLPYPFQGPFDYRVPPELDPKPGDLVVVPLNQREEIGVVWDGPSAGGGVPDSKLKPLIAILDTPPMLEPLRRFVDWVAAYTLAPPGEVMAMALRVVEREPRPSPRQWQVADPPPSGKLTPARERVFAALTGGLARSAGELARLAAVSPGVVREMARSGWIVPNAAAPPPAFGTPEPDRPGPILSPEQQSAADVLRERTAARAFSVTLLEGVTGSGKTEVYFEAIAACLREGRQALVLLPEIALSSQWLGRFVRRFGVEPAVWHSDLSSRIRRMTWRAVAFGEARVVVGARSALFLPFADLGLVVVDEEHETAFKQEDGVIYHARDMAVVRARFSGAPIVLVSATPAWRRWPMSRRGAMAASASPRGTRARRCPSFPRWICGSIRRSAAGSWPRRSSLPSRRRSAAPSRRCCS